MSDMSDTDFELVLFVIITLIIDEFLWRFLWLCLNIVKCKLLREIHFVTGKLRQNKTKLGLLLHSYNTAIVLLVGKRFSTTVSVIDEDDKMKNECIRFESHKGVPDDSQMSTDYGIQALKVNNDQYSSTGSSATNDEKTVHRTHGNVSAQTVTDKERGASRISTIDAPTSYGSRTNTENCFAQSNDCAAENMPPKAKAKEKYITIEARLNSFAKWPKRKTIDPGQLASAGMFYTGDSDIVVCFSCGVQLLNWEKGDDPFKEHAQWNPHCQNLQDTKGHAFIKKHQVARPKCSFQGNTMNRDIIHKTQGRGECSPLNVQQGTNRGGDRILCNICKKAKRNVLVFPCLHLASCDLCASSLRACPECSDEVKGTMKVYF